MVNKELLHELKNFLDNEFKVVKVDEGKVLNTSKGACFTISKVASKILNGLGYRCNVKRVKVMSGNKKGIELFIKQRKTGFDRDEIIKEDGWIIGIGCTPEMFHYVIYFPDDKEVMDLTYSQANRPEHELICEAYWEKLDNLPETIITLEFVEGIEPDTFSPIYYDHKGIFKHIIKKGRKELIKWKVSR